MFDLIVLGIIAVFMIFTFMKNNPCGYDRYFRFRRFINWFPLGLSYAFLYMGRYNLTVSKMALGSMMSNIDFGQIFFAGTLVYALSFIINGPLTDRFGGRFSILLATSGSAIMNAIMGVVTYKILHDGAKMNITNWFIVLYSINMYFQSLGAVSIIKVNSHWFHVRERGVFGSIFGILIALGLYFAFDWGDAIVNATKVTPINMGFISEILRNVIVGHTAPAVDQTWWVFFIPAVLLSIFFIIAFSFVKDSPKIAGLVDLDTEDASSGDEQQYGPLKIFVKIITNKVILTIALIEFCTGVVRNSIMHWYPIYMSQINKGLASKGLVEVVFFKMHWGKFLMLAGILGGIFAGFVSDKLFNSRRGPSAVFLYASMLVLVILMCFVLDSYYLLGALAILISLCVIGVHGMLSGTASMDFGGRKGAATSAGIIDGFVYLGTAVQAISLGYLTTKDWHYWTIFIIPFTIIGLILSVKIWHAFPKAVRKGKINIK